MNRKPPGYSSKEMAKFLIILFAGIMIGVGIHQTARYVTQEFAHSYTEAELIRGQKKAFEQSENLIHCASKPSTCTQPSNILANELEETVKNEIMKPLSDWRKAYHYTHKYEDHALAPVYTHLVQARKLVKKNPALERHYSMLMYSVMVHKGIPDFVTKDSLLALMTTQ